MVFMHKKGGDDMIYIRVNELLKQKKKTWEICMYK